MTFFLGKKYTNDNPYVVLHKRSSGLSKPSNDLSKRFNDFNTLTDYSYDFLSLKFEYLFEENYAWVRARFPELWIEPRAKTAQKKVQKEL